MSGSMQNQRNFNLYNEQKMISAVSDRHCAVFCEENSSFCCDAEVFSGFLWNFREAAAAVNSGAC